MTFGRRPLRPSDRRQRRLPRDIRQAIVDALLAAELKNCGEDQTAQDTMRLYLTSWVADPLRRVLAWDDGSKDVKP